MPVQDLGAYTNICARFAETLDFRMLPATVVEKTKCCLLDWLGCAIAGSRHDMAGTARSYVHIMGGNAAARMVGEKSGSMELAAFFNGFLGSVLEMDDVEKTSVTHPTAVVLPAALAAGEWARKNGRDLIVALVAGYEVMMRVSAAMMPNHYAIWHTTGTSGAFGAATAAARLFGLAAPRMDWALGNAGTMAAGLWQCAQDGGLSKFLHVGKAASNGLSAALLARLGLPGATRILEGPQGFYAGFARQEIAPVFFADFGSVYYTGQIAVKLYPCCGQSHAAIDAADMLRKTVQGRKITSLRVQITSLAMQVAGKENPVSPVDAKFSIPFCVARTLLHAPVTESDFSPGALRDEAVRELMRRTAMEISPEFDATKPGQWPCRIIAALDDGTQIEAEVANARGGPDTPLGWSGIEDKFARMTDGLLTDAARDAIRSLCGNLEELENIGDILELVNTSMLPARAS